MQFGTRTNNPAVSVIIVTFNRTNDLIQCLVSLFKNNPFNYEVIVVDNGEIDTVLLKCFNITYIKLDTNIGVSAARNIGIDFASSEIVAFLDDDATVHLNWVKSIYTTLNRTDNILCMRGIVLPKSKLNLFNLVAPHYNLGQTIIPALIDLEGNCAFYKDLLLKVGGFSDNLFGMEGTELLYRLSKYHTSPFSYYNPQMIIYHDYSPNLNHFITKSYRHGTFTRYTESKYPDLIKYKNKIIQLMIQKGLHTKKHFIVLEIIKIILAKIGQYYYQKGYNNNSTILHKNTF